MRPMTILRRLHQPGPTIFPHPAFRGVHRLGISFKWTKTPFLLATNQTETAGAGASQLRDSVDTTKNCVLVCR